MHLKIVDFVCLQIIYTKIIMKEQCIVYNIILTMGGDYLFVIFFFKIIHSVVLPWTTVHTCRDDF